MALNLNEYIKNITKMQKRIKITKFLILIFTKYDNQFTTQNAMYQNAHYFIAL